MAYDTRGAVDAIMETSAVADLGALFGALAAALGMSASACGMVSGSRVLGAGRFHFTNWPPDWLQLYRARNFAAIDPLPRWAIVSGEAVSWTQVIDGLDRHDPGRIVYETANAHGFYEGFATPVRTRDGAFGLVTVGGGRRAGFSTGERLHLQAISVAALNHAETLRPHDAPTPFTLTGRERECVALLQQGFSDPEIARALAITPPTVRFHLENARRKAGARNRVELAVRAAYPAG